VAIKNNSQLEGHFARTHFVQHALALSIQLSPGVEPLIPLTKLVLRVNLLAGDLPTASFFFGESSLGLKQQSMAQSIA